MTRIAPSSSAPAVVIHFKNMDDEGPGRDVPKRTPFDWFRHPLTEAFARANVIEDAIYLDTIFKRLYCGSETFRALLALNPDVARIPAMVNLLKKNVGALDIKFEEVDINPEEIGRDEKGYTGLWVIAHEYRHAFQLRQDATIFAGKSLAEAPNTSLKSFLALHRAMEADSNAFAATCLHEVLVHEGLSLPQIGQAMADTTMARIMSIHTWFAQHTERNLASGHAATHAFDAFFHHSNKDMLGIYDAKILGVFKPFSCVEDHDHSQPDGFAARFNAMKTMPYLTKDGGTAERDNYLAEIDFSVMKKLPHLSLKNRLHRVMLLSPFRLPQL